MAVCYARFMCHAIATTRWVRLLLTAVADGTAVEDSEPDTDTPDADSDINRDDVSPDPAPAPDVATVPGSPTESTPSSSRIASAATFSGCRVATTVDGVMR